MIYVTKITPLDRHIREFKNPFISEVIAPLKPMKQKDKAPKRAPDKQTIKQPHQIEPDRYKGQEVEWYEPLYRKLNEQYPVKPRY